MSKVGGSGGAGASGGAGRTESRPDPGPDRSGSAGPDRSGGTGPDRTGGVTDKDRTGGAAKAAGVDAAGPVEPSPAQVEVDRLARDGFEVSQGPSALDARAQEPVVETPPVDVDLQAELRAEIAAQSTRTVIPSRAPAEAPIAVEAAPVDPTPVDAAPVDAAPVDAAPVDAAPVDPTLTGAELTPEVAADVDAAALAADALRDQFATDPAAASRELATQVEALTEITERAELLGSYETELAGAIDRIETGEIAGPEANEVMTEITRAAELSGQEAAQSLADAAAAALADNGGVPSRDLARAVEQSITAGAGALLGGELARSVGELPNVTNMRLDGAVADAVGTLRTDFTRAQDAVTALEQRWHTQQEELIGRLGPDDMQAARDAFEAQHADAYAAYETAAERLGTTLTGLGNIAEQPEVISPTFGLPTDHQIRIEADRVAAMMPDLQSTEAGLNAIAEQVAQRGRQQPNLLNQMVTSLRSAHGGANQAAALIANATSRGALLAAQAGNQGLAQDLLSGLRASSGAFGISEERMGAIADALSEINGAATPEARQAAAEALRRQMDIGGTEVGFGGSNFSNLIGGIGGAFAVANGIGAMRDGVPHPDGIAGELRNFVDVMGGSIDATVGIANFIGQNSSFLSRTMPLVQGAERFGARVLGPIGGVLDGAIAINHLREGRNVEAALSGLSAAGAIAMAVPGGQLLGAGLLTASFVGGLANNAWNARQDRLHLESDFATTFEALGFSPERAAALAQRRGGMSQFSEIFDFMGGGPGTIDQMLALTPQAEARTLEAARIVSTIHDQLTYGAQMPGFSDQSMMHYQSAGGHMGLIADANDPLQAQRALDRLATLGWPPERLQELGVQIQANPSPMMLWSPGPVVDSYQQGLQALLQAAGI